MLADKSTVVGVGGSFLDQIRQGFYRWIGTTTLNGSVPKSTVISVGEWKIVSATTVLLNALVANVFPSYQN